MNTHETPSLQLSLDARVQFILRDELSKVVQQFNAKGAAGIIMDVHTGEVVAMVSLPDFDPNHPAPPTRTAARGGQRGDLQQGNARRFELGSVFKIFNTAMALDSGVATMTSQIRRPRSDIRIGRFTISDYHGKHRWLSVPEIFMYSSNLGSARMAVAAGTQRQQDFLGRLGILQTGQYPARRDRDPALPEGQGVERDQHA